MSSLNRIFSIVLAVLLISSCLPKTSNSGKVIKVKDGDSIVLLDSLNQEVEIRLAYIDAPESRQDFGTKSKAHLSDLIYNKKVDYKIIEPKDRYGRVIAEIVLNDSIIINKEMIAAGMAWHYDQYPGGFFYEQLERKARKADLGIWSQPSPIAPWEFRHK